MQGVSCSLPHPNALCSIHVCHVPVLGVPTLQLSHGHIQMHNNIAHLLPVAVLEATLTAKAVSRGYSSHGGLTCKVYLHTGCRTVLVESSSMRA